MFSIIALFGILGNITTGLVYLSPAKTFWRIARNRSTEEFESIPYICKLLNAYQWVYYGIIKPNSVLVATINGFGAVVELVFIVIFLMFASTQKIRVRTAILFGVLDLVFPAVSFLLMQLMLHGQLRIDISGMFCVVFSMITYGSPLSAMKTVVATKSVEYMPLLLSFFLFINGGVWTVYAFLTDDYFIGIPNGTGFLLGTAQLILYVIYMKPKPSEKISDNLEDGSKHEPLIPSSNLVS
ncbi:PREDICTED: bidirectional sugar transporter SWEET17-like [Populus euphratica]|uniref:Bidirectional sugar transporter SWEET n=1 Tax=Populus euphratica TaxID=75702 RepID=A0AAJ6XLU6_POPEU|nr:PREDICTED: bidirectional sugar transporter SWEET17-like [Populus euphratica]